MILAAKIYVGIGLLIILVKCILAIWFNHKGFHYTKEGIIRCILAFVIDLVIWPADLVVMYKYLTNQYSDDFYYATISETVEKNESE